LGPSLGGLCSPPKEVRENEWAKTADGDLLPSGVVIATTEAIAIKRDLGEYIAQEISEEGVQ